MEPKIKLGDLASYINGYAFKPSDRGDKGLPIIRIQDLTGNPYDLGFYDGEYPKKIEINNGDVLISWSASLGVYIWNQGKALLNQHIFKVVFDKLTVDKDYFVFAVRYNLNKMIGMTHGATMKHIVKKDFDNILIPFPNLETQKEISTVLKKTQIIIEKKQYQIELLDCLTKSRFLEMFGDLGNPSCKWKKYKLIDVCSDSDDVKCGPFGTQLNKEEYTDSGIAIWEIPQINSEFKLSPAHFVTEKKAKSLASYSIKPGDIAMSRKGNVGKCAVFPNKFSEGIIHSDVLRIRVDSNITNPEFMMRQLHYSGDIQHQIELVSAGAIMAGINVTKLKQILVYAPPIDLQNEFANFVAQTDKSR